MNKRFWWNISCSFYPFHLKLSDFQFLIATSFKFSRGTHFYFFCFLRLFLQSQALLSHSAFDSLFPFLHVANSHLLARMLSLPPTFVFLIRLEAMNAKKKEKMQPWTPTKKKRNGTLRKLESRRPGSLWWRFVALWTTWPCSGVYLYA